MIDSGDAAPVMDPLGVRLVPALSDPKLAEKASAQSTRLTFGAAVGTRLLVWIAALAAIAIFGGNDLARNVLDPAGITPSIHAGLLTKLLAPAARWDSVWYLQIAAHGYFSPASANFFPLYPLLLHLATPLFGNAIVAGIAISLGSMAAGLMLLYRLALLELGAPAARMTVILIAVFPTSLFLSAVYPTSLYLMLTLAAVYAARHDRWALAGIFGGLAAATRSNGILVVVVLGLMYLYGPRGRSPLAEHVGAWWRPRFRPKLDVAWLALVPAGLALYLGYIWIAHDAPLAPYRAAHLYWYHSFGAPIGAIIDALGQVPGDVRAIISGVFVPMGPNDPIGAQGRNLIDLGYLAVAVAGAAAAWRRVPRVYVIYAGVLLVEATSFPIPNEPMVGLGRYLLPMFALFMGGGAYLAERPAAARIAVVTSAALLVVCSGLWGQWLLVP